VRAARRVTGVGCRWVVGVGPGSTGWHLVEPTLRERGAPSLVLIRRCGTFGGSGVRCWTPDGSLDGRGPHSGGTGGALRIAAGEALGSQVFNRARDEHLRRVWTFVGEPNLQDRLSA